MTARAQAALTRRRAVLLINVGTPDAPTPAAVRRFLAEFLGDPRVLDVHPVVRFALLRGVILPFRPARSARAYRAIWTPDGSPLLVHVRELALRLSERMPDALVLPAMRYGSPSLADAVRRIDDEGIGHVVLVPLYPQYASSSTGAALEESYRLLGRLLRVPAIRVVQPFYSDPGYLDVVARRIAASRGGGADPVVFSYHGLPVRHVRALARNGHACEGGARSACCLTLGAGNAACYRAQCVATSRGLGDRLSLPPDRWHVAFQSRLGRSEWLAPDTTDVLRKLAQQGAQRVVVACPSFVSDCLETLEEMGIRGRQIFREAGGKELTLVPAPNGEPSMADVLARLIGPGAAP